jgi:ABC-2 type transport system ATP-binding protein
MTVRNAPTLDSEMVQAVPEDTACPAIEATGLTKQFGDVVAVDDLNLHIPAGVVYGFLGPNGSGKTTTMRMLTTLVRPTAGTAAIAGVSIDDRPAAIAKLGYLPEEPPLFDELTGREQLRHVAALHDIPRSVADARIDRYLDRFGLTDAADRRIDGYSKGMRQKLGLIQAVVHEPSVVFLDEPTSGLDPRAARTVRDLIQEFAEGDATIFLSTHILSVVEELADVVGVLHHGRLVAEGSPDDLKARAAAGDERSLEAVFLSLTADHAADAASSVDATFKASPASQRDGGNER